MNPKWLVLICILAATPFVFGNDGSDAESFEHTTYYCYGDSPTLSFPYAGNGITVTWSAIDSNGEKVICFPETGPETAIQLSGLDYVRVTQTVTDGTDTDTKTIILIGLHAFVGDTVNDSYTVTFYDGNSIISSSKVDRTTVVEYGHYHVDVPTPAQKKDFAFSGWYADSDFETLFDPTEPIKGDTGVHAKWISSSSTLITVNSHIVSFEVVNGLTYTIDSVGRSSVTFTVGVADGFDIDPSVIRVTSDSGRIRSVDDDTYILDSIGSDVTVFIGAENYFTITYNLSHASITFENGPVLPAATFPGELKYTVSADFGWSMFGVTVTMGGEDITSQCVKDGVIDIEKVTGDVVITANADFPLLYVILLAIIIVVCVIYAYIRLKRSESRDGSE